MKTKQETNGKTNQKEKTRKNNVLIVDGQNLLKYTNGEKDPHNIEVVRSWAEEVGIRVFFIFPSYHSIRKIVNSREDVIFLDSTIYDDIGILEYARDCDAAILSNDQFREFRDEYSDYDFSKVFPYAIANNNLITEATEYFDYPFVFVFSETGAKIIFEVAT